MLSAVCWGRLLCESALVYVVFGFITSQLNRVYISCFQEFSEALPTSKCRANNPAKLFVLPEAAQLAVVASVYQGTVRLIPNDSVWCTTCYHVLVLHLYFSPEVFDAFPVIADVDKLMQALLVVILRNNNYGWLVKMNYFSVLCHLAGLWQSLLSAASIFCSSLYIHVIFTCWFKVSFFCCHLAVQAIPAVATHFSVAWSVCLSVCLSHSWS